VGFVFISFNESKRISTTVNVNGFGIVKVYRFLYISIKVNRIKGDFGPTLTVRDDGTRRAYNIIYLVIDNIGVYRSDKRGGRCGAARTLVQLFGGAPRVGCPGADKLSSPTPLKRKTSHRIILRPRGIVVHDIFRN